MLAHERLTEPRVKRELLLAKSRSFSNLPAFLDLSGIKSVIKDLSEFQYFCRDKPLGRLELNMNMFIENDIREKFLLRKHVNPKPTVILE